MKKLFILIMVLFSICNAPFAVNAGVRHHRNGYVDYIFLASHAVKGENNKWLDYGSGMCTLIRCQDSYQLVDTFTKYGAEHNVIPYLTNNNITHIDNIFITHYHNDHCDGLIPILTAGITTDMVYLPPQSDWTSTALVKLGAEAANAKIRHDKIVGFLNKNKINWKYATNETVELNNDLKVKVFNTDFSYLYALTTIRPKGNNSTYLDKGIYIDFNNYSVFYQFEYDGSKALFTGDANYTPLMHNIKNFEKVQLWNITHHNHDRFIVPVFLKTINPDIVVSQDTANEYGLSDNHMRTWKMGKYCISLGSRFYSTKGENIVVRLSKSGSQVVSGVPLKNAETQFTYEELVEWKQNIGTIMRSDQVTLPSRFIQE